MDLNDYQHEAKKFARYYYKDYPFLGLQEEVGEVIGKLAKYVRKRDTTLTKALVDASMVDGPDAGVDLRQDLKKELGDCLWMLQACAKELGFSMNEIAISNLYKLRDRDGRGVIVGEGDNR